MVMYDNKVGTGRLCCKGKLVVGEPIREMSSHATHQEMLVNSCLSSLSHCGLILGQWRCWWVEFYSLFFLSLSFLKCRWNMIPPESSCARNKPPPHVLLQVNSSRMQEDITQGTGNVSHYEWLQVKTIALLIDAVSLDSITLCRAITR